MKKKKVALPNKIASSVRRLRICGALFRDMRLTIWVRVDSGIERILSFFNSVGYNPDGGVSLFR